MKRKRKKSQYPPMLIPVSAGKKTEKHLDRCIVTTVVVFAVLGLSLYYGPLCV